jgi:hypothetical protein
VFREVYVISDSLLWVGLNLRSVGECVEQSGLAVILANDFGGLIQLLSLKVDFEKRSGY